MFRVVDRLNDKVVATFDSVYDAEDFVKENRNKYGFCLIIQFDVERR